LKDVKTKIKPKNKS